MEADLGEKEAAILVGYYIEDRRPYALTPYWDTWVEDHEGCTLAQAKNWLAAHESEVRAAVKQRNEEWDL